MVIPDDFDLNKFRFSKRRNDGVTLTTDVRSVCHERYSAKILMYTVRSILLMRFYICGSHFDVIHSSQDPVYRIITFVK